MWKGKAILTLKAERKEEWYCINCGKYYDSFQFNCERCLEQNTIEEGDW